LARRIWKYKEQALAAVSPALVEACGNQPLLAKLLALRGITEPAEAGAFLNLTDYQPTSGMEFPDMAKAVERIQQAIAGQESILVYGDFDVDGITGTAILYECLKGLNANVSYYVPSRHTEGHGLNAGALCRLVSSRQLKVVITTDTGSSNFNEVNLLNGLKVDTIITDHHELPEHLPQALAILNPKLLAPQSPFAMLSGAGVAYKLCEILLDEIGRPAADKERLLDLCAIGTVVDLVPLLRENRYLVWRGLQVLNWGERLGIKAILQEANVNDSTPLTEQTLGFTIGPRLNAIGRLSDASEGVELLITQDKERARQLAAKLEQMNRRRRDLVEEGLIQAEKHLQYTGELAGENAVILASPDWNQGIVGLVATKLIEKYYRPCFIGTVDDDSQEVRFSARSIEGFDMHQNLQALEDMFLRWGGHSGAAGFAIRLQDLDKLKTRLFGLCRERITDETLIPIIWLDLKLTPDQINPYLIEMINNMAPFGQGNPLPVFGMEQATIGAQKMLGEDRRHLKLILDLPEKGRHLEAIHWNWGADNAKLNPSEKVNLAFTVEENTFNGATKIQLLLKDLDAPSQPKAQSRFMTKPQSIETITSPVIPAKAGIHIHHEDTQWIDHRGRENLDGFLYHILGPSLDTPEQAQYRIYCEGTQHYFPIPLAPQYFCTRMANGTHAPQGQLLLWDLPPDQESLQALLKTYQPQVVHLIGGKYQTIPLSRPPREFLQGTLAVITRMQQPQSTAPFVVHLPQLESLLSSSKSVVMAGLSLLNRLSYLNLRAMPETRQFEIHLNPASGNLQTECDSLIEYQAFANALEEVQQFRTWMMTAPLSVIKSGLNHTYEFQTDEREPYVVHLDQ